MKEIITLIALVLLDREEIKSGSLMLSMTSETDKGR